MLNYQDLKQKPRELLAATGLKQDEYEALLAVFVESYRQSYPANRTKEGQPRQRREGGGNKGRLAKFEDKLLFILVYEKTYPLQTMLGLQFGLSQGQANMWIHRLLPVLNQAFQIMGQAPVRDGSQVAESTLAQAGGVDLIIDGTERRRQRPHAEPAQTEHYSGKKSTHRQESRFGQSPQPESSVFVADPARPKT